LSRPGGSERLFVEAICLRLVSALSGRPLATSYRGDSGTS